MKLKFRVIIILVLGLFFQKTLIGAPVDEIAGGLVKELKGNKKKIAVIGFEAPDKLEKFSNLLAERLTTSLVQTKKGVILERRLLKKILEEQGLSMTGVMDNPDQAGKLLNVDYVILGTLLESNEVNAELNVRMVDVKSGEIISAMALELELNDKRDDISKINYQDETQENANLIQVAILLDTSNSMDGLISQAKTQLWKIVNEMAVMKKNGKTPVVEIALYEYGNQGLSVTKGYTRQVLGFTANMDKVSKELFSLTTNGGNEYAGYVIRDAVKMLKWKNSKDTYKAIFIAGNESFRQGNVKPEDAIQEGKNKNIFINTIFCGSPSEVDARGWKSAADISGGMFLNIDQNRERRVIATPYDEKIQNLNMSLNSTFIPYGGAEAKRAKEEQIAQDEMASQYKSSGAPVERAANKAMSQYSQAATEWDIISALENGTLKLEDVDPAKLPDEYKKKSKKDVQRILSEKLEERKKIKNEILELSKKRKEYQQKEIEKQGQEQENSLDVQMKKAIKEQANELNYR